MNEELTEKWKEIMRQKWEGANTGGHNAISTPVMEEILSDIENLLEQERERIRTFLKDSSVWDAEYIYHRKSLLLEKYDSFINPSRYH